MFQICQKLNLRFSIIVIYILTISAMLIKTKLVFEVKVKALIGSNIKIYFIFFVLNVNKTQLFQLQGCSDL
jgi:hypothetical protein